MAAAPSRVKRPNPGRPVPDPSGSNPTRFYLLLGALALVGGGALVYLITRPKGVSIPANVTVLAADTAGFRGYLLGSDSARVEISEYADYQCPACQDFEMVQFPSVRKQLLQTGLARWRYRDFPLDAIHRHARLAAHSAACAEEQGKFWPQHERIYQLHPKWSVASNAAAILRDAARQVGLDLSKYDGCMTSTKYAGRIQASLDEGTKLGVSSTPTFLIAGRLYRGVFSSDSLRSIVNSLIAKPAS